MNASSSSLNDSHSHLQLHQQRALLHSSVQHSMPLRTPIAASPTCHFLAMMMGVSVGLSGKTRHLTHRRLASSVIATRTTQPTSALAERSSCGIAKTKRSFYRNRVLMELSLTCNNASRREAMPHGIKFCEKQDCLKQIQGGQQMKTNHKSAGLLESAGNHKP